MCDGCRQKDRENGYFIFCIRNGIILKEDAKNCPLFKGAKNTEQLLQPDSAMSRFLLVVATLFGKNRAKTPRRLSKC